MFSSHIQMITKLTYIDSCEKLVGFLSYYILLSSLQISDLYVIPTRFYESSKFNEQIRMHDFPHPAYKWLYLWNRIRYEHVTNIRLLLKVRALIWYPI